MEDSRIERIDQFANRPEPIPKKLSETAGFKMIGSEPNLSQPEKRKK